MNKNTLKQILFLTSMGFANLVHAQFDQMNSSILKKNALESPNQSSSIIQTDKIYKVEQRKLQYFSMPNVSITNTQFEKISNPILDKKVDLPKSFEIQTKISIERKQAIAFIFIPQYIQNPDGSIEKLISYDITVQETPPPSQKTAGTRVYATNSILASGNFYKIALNTQGLYKIDYNFIKNNLGIEPSNINPANIRLYGNGGELLSENNAVVPLDDLVENAIQVIDGGDGQFNPSDYILFYANGPHTIKKDSINKGFTHTFNIYSESSYYFLNFDLGIGKRIQNATNPSTSNTTVNSFNEFQFIEKDSSNPGKFGKTWWGDEFSDQPGRYLSRNYNFNIPSIDPTAPVSVRTRFGAISFSGINLMEITANGQPLYSSNINSVGSSYSDPVTNSVDLIENFSSTSPTINIGIKFTKGSSTASGYLDFLEINARRNLSFKGYLNFADWNTVGAGNIANYQIQNANANTQVWDITNPLLPIKMTTILTGSTLSFNQDASSLHRFIALDGSQTSVPSFIEKTSNQNLHAYTPKDYIIISHPSLKNQAEALAAHHLSKRNVKFLIVTPQEIYNEFSSGSQDISALRDFLKMYYDRASINDIPKYVLLFGDASYDFKNRVKNNTNLVPSYQTAESNDKIFGYCTDDFFGFLDDSEDINNFDTGHINTLDIGIGRIPAVGESSAAAIVNKIINYDSPNSFGPWKNSMTFNADDEDDGIHLDDGEIMSKFATDSLPNFNSQKIYVDGFVQQSTPAGPRTPDANNAVREQIYNGTFLMNYNGHGGPLGWCEERIFSMDDVNLMTNINKLPLFITATCDFAPFDDPALVSAGEILLNKPDGGAIALMTTTRLVYQDQNRDMNLNYMSSGFKRLPNEQYPTLGEAYRISKNLRYVTYVGSFAAANFRKFALLGDPALPLAFPKHNIVTDSINGTAVSVAYDTLKALGKYTISGHVADQNGNLLSGFNGIVYPVIYDKPKKLSTLQNDPNSPKKEYFVQNNAIYKGKATVKNGKFSFTFVVPKDINYQISKGKISYYSDNGIEDAAGNDKQIYIGGSNPNAGSDNVGPIIKAYLNNDKFVNGGITTSNSTLLLKLSDDNGINYTGNSIGHDITATLDGNAQTTYVLIIYFSFEKIV
ncbi:MAG TPA: type IX secretion system sortase PorU [Chitinophagaceae bacterium]|nr:type IX secretion system sortase PorU [Chitinophagaceae bacterium]